MLAEQVKAGKLPLVEQRLPSDPLVVPVVERIGQYGGVWRRAFLGPADFNNYVRVVYDALAPSTGGPRRRHPRLGPALAGRSSACWMRRFSRSISNASWLIANLPVRWGSRPVSTEGLTKA